jgi:hypothetical protein
VDLFTLSLETGTSFYMKNFKVYLWRFLRLVYVKEIHFQFKSKLCGKTTTLYLIAVFCKGIG